ncbi:MAG: GTP cyclohydrolase I FolE [Desulfovibrio sp.]|nr:GTP cyclohydrolase I FolE [Desulfovibrio sp.]
MIDQEKICAAVRLFLEGIGEDASREGLRETPDRVARMCHELFEGHDQAPLNHLTTQFSSRHHGLVMEKNIAFYSLCEHHLLPFFGKIHIAYMAQGKVVGLSKLARTVEVFARRLQIQENLGYDIGNALMQALSPAGVMIVIRATHMCMSMRGVKKESAETVTVATLGCFNDDRELMNSCMRELLSA